MMAGLPASSRSAIFSPAFVPATVSVPRFSFGRSRLGLIVLPCEPTMTRPKPVGPSLTTALLWFAAEAPPVRTAAVNKRTATVSSRVKRT
jgi:hypothetical protein